jgi:hypothetical protein
MDASEPLRRVAIAAAFINPLAGAAAGADLKPLIGRNHLWYWSRGRWRQYGRR